MKRAYEPPRPCWPRPSSLTSLQPVSPCPQGLGKPLNNESSRRKKRSDAWDIKEKVQAWVHAHARCEFGDSSKDESAQSVEYFVAETKKAFARDFARHHDIIDGKAVLCPKGDRDPSVPSLTRFKADWPHDVSYEKWHNCICVLCHKMDLALYDVLRVRFCR